MKKIILLAMALMLAITPALAAGKLAIGTSMGYPTLKLNLNKNIDGSLGAMYASGAASSTALLVKVDYNLASVGKVQPNLGLYYTTNGAAAARTVLGLTYGLLTKVQPNLAFGLDFILVSQLTFAGATTTGLLGAGFVGGSTGVVVTAAYTL